MLELLDALAEAWSTIEQELRSFSSCRLLKAAKAESQQEESERANCVTTWWAAKSMFRAEMKEKPHPSTDRDQREGGRFKHGNRSHLSVRYCISSSVGADGPLALKCMEFRNRFWGESLPEIPI